MEISKQQRSYIHEIIHYQKFIRVSQIYFENLFMHIMIIISRVKIMWNVTRKFNK